MKGNYRVRAQDIAPGALDSWFIQIRQTAQIDSAASLITLSFGANPKIVFVGIDSHIYTPYQIRWSIDGSLIYVSLWGGTFSAVVGVFGSLAATISYPFIVTGLITSR